MSLSCSQSTGGLDDNARTSFRYPGRFFLSFCGLILAASLAAQTPTQRGVYPNYPSETPAQLEVNTDAFNYDKREVMIPMRDGVNLHTVIIVPKGAKHAPILLTRTPYNAAALTSHAASRQHGDDQAQRAPRRSAGSGCCCSLDYAGEQQADDQRQDGHLERAQPQGAKRFGDGKEGIEGGCAFQRNSERKTCRQTSEGQCGRHADLGKRACAGLFRHALPLLIGLADVTLAALGDIAIFQGFAGTGER